MDSGDICMEQDAANIKKTTRVQCDVCFRRFSSKMWSRQPLVGQCGHTFCRFCSRKLKGKCARCRASFKPEKNFSLIDSLEHIEQLKGSLKAMKEQMKKAGLPTEEDEEESEESGAEEEAMDEDFEEDVAEEESDGDDNLIEFDEDDEESESDDDDQDVDDEDPHDFLHDLGFYGREYFRLLYMPAEFHPYRIRRSAAAEDSGNESEDEEVEIEDDGENLEIEIVGPRDIYDPEDPLEPGHDESDAEQEEEEDQDELNSDDENDDVIEETERFPAAFSQPEATSTLETAMTLLSHLLGKDENSLAPSSVEMNDPEQLDFYELARRNLRDLQNLYIQVIEPETLVSSMLNTLHNQD